jgi:type I restriction enzyme M protein
MPLTPDMRRSIDQIRDYLFGGGYPDPVSNAEQLSFLFFFYLVEGIDAENKLKAKVLKIPCVTTIPRSHFKWSVWAKGLSGEALVRFVRDEVFAFFTEMGEGRPQLHARRPLAIDDPTVLTQVVSLVDGLRLDQADSDTKGDLFEHVLRQIKQAGELGQFRTPRHIIRAMVEMVDPKVGETIYDPAAGTAGFLVAAYNHIRLAQLIARGIVEVELDGKKQRVAWATSSRPRRPGACKRHLLRQRRGPEDGAPGHHEPDPARPAQCAHRAAQRADHHARQRAQGRTRPARRRATTWCWPIRRFRAGWTRIALWRT